MTRVALMHESGRRDLCLNISNLSIIVFLLHIHALGAHLFKACWRAHRSSCGIYLLGANVTSWALANGSEVLYVRDDSEFDGVTPIRCEGPCASSYLCWIVLPKADSPSVAMQRGHPHLLAAVRPRGRVLWGNPGSGTAAGEWVRTEHAMGPDRIGVPFPAPAPGAQAAGRAARGRRGLTRRMASRMSCCGSRTRRNRSASGRTPLSCSTRRAALCIHAARCAAAPRLAAGSHAHAPRTGRCLWGSGSLVAH